MMITVQIIIVSFVLVNMLELNVREDIAKFGLCKKKPEYTISDEQLDSLNNQDAFIDTVARRRFCLRQKVQVDNSLRRQILYFKIISDLDNMKIELEVERPRSFPITES
mgnify:CR=1 FL=1